MIKKIVLASIGVLAAYLCFWPVPVEPVAWQAPANPGYTGAFAQNQQLSQVNRIELTNDIGPEDLAVNSQGLVYFSLLSGDIKYLDQQGNIQPFVKLKGRALGIEFDQQDNLIVADAYNGLLSINPKGEITTLLTEVAGKPLYYTNDVDIASNGFIYFSDSSSKFIAKEHGTYGASLLDMMEHGGHGRVMVFNPETKQATELATGLQFANGVALSHDEQSLIVNETGRYRVLRLPLTGENQGKVEVLIDELPGFPDNLAQGTNGVYWVGLVSPRSKPLDLLSDSPFLRKMVQRLPAFVRPQAQSFGHVIAVNDQGDVVHNMQDPLGMFGLTTGAVEVGNKLYISSLHEPALAVTSNINFPKEGVVEGQLSE